MHQGDPLGPVVFSAGIHYTAGISCDVFAVGEPTSVFSFLEEFKCHSSQLVYR